MMLKLVLAASAVALASVMAISAGPASAQSICPSANQFITGPSWGMMRPPCEDRYVNYGGTRYVNSAGDPIVAAAPYVAPRPFVATADYITGPRWGMMRPPGFDNRYVAYGGTRYVNYSGSTLVGPAPYVASAPSTANYITGPRWGMMRPPAYDQRFVNYAGVGADHAARCEARYRSYNAATNTFLGYDGRYHQCAL